MGTTALLSSIGLVIMVGQARGKTSESNYRAFSQCQVNWASPASPISSLSVTSFSACAVACLESCLAFNICGKKDKEIMCYLLQAIVLNECSGLYSAPGCSYWEKELMPCQNGGTRGSTKCLCVDGYAGPNCERYGRSCKELKDLSVTTTGYYMIQPIGSPVAYCIYCSLQYSQTVYFFVRHRHMACSWINYDMSWDEYRNGWGDVTCGEYFVGLETLYQLMKYEQFRFKACGIIGGGSVEYYYSNFTILSEAENYRMNYANGFNLDADHGDILGGERPRDFCTRDRDCGSCAASKGGGWWYSSGCGGNHMTSSLADFVWSVAGVDTDMDIVYLQLDHMGYL